MREYLDESKEAILFVAGKGHRKREEQRSWETLDVLKPGYNVQIAGNSEYITGVDVFSNRTDYGTLVPFLKHVQKMQRGQRLP